MDAACTFLFASALILWNGPIFSARSLFVVVFRLPTWCHKQSQNINNTTSKLCVVHSKNPRKKRCWNLCNNLWQSLNVIPRKLITFDFIFLWTKLCLCVCVCLFFQWRVQKKICTQRLLSDSKHIQAQNSVYVVQGRMAIGVYNFEFLLWAHIESVTFCLLMLLRLMLMLPLLLLLPFEFQDFGHRLIRAQAI